MNNRVQDQYEWFVQYKDASWHAEFDETRPDGRGFLEIDQAQIQRIALGFYDGEYFHFYHQVAVPEGAQPVFFRRRTRTISPALQEIIQTDTIHCIGWKAGEVAVYLFIHADGSTLLTDDLQAV